MKLFKLRPTVKNPSMWFPERPPKSEWDKIRSKVLERDDHTCRFCGHRATSYMNIHHKKNGDDNSLRNLITCCVACHAVLHFGRNLALGLIEIWECPTPQVEIVQKTRKGIKAGKSLAEIKKTFSLSEGPFPPGSVDHANKIIDTGSDKHEFVLKEPYSVIFTGIKRWQI